MKYIDSEKLIAEIDKKWRELADKNVKIGGGKYDIEIYAYLSIINLITSFQQEQPSLPSNLDEAAEEFTHNYDMGTCGGIAQDCFKAGAEWQREQYECIPAEEAYMRGFAQGAKEERKDLAPLINRLCEAILFEWKDAADLARKTLTQIKAREEEK